MRNIKIIGSAVGNCGRIKGCESAPNYLMAKLSEMGSLIDADCYPYNGDANDINTLHTYFSEVATHISQLLHRNNFPLLLGGDHSCAIGTWSGVSNFVATKNQELGLIWIDAHFDAHTPDTSESGNVHGMSMSHLLGHGDQKLSSILNEDLKIKPENIVYLGIRSYETAEIELVKKLGIKTYFQEQLTEENFPEILSAEFKRLSLNTNNIGISLDLDGLSANEFKAVGTPVDGGVSGQSLMNALAKIDFSKLIAFEIAEYNPHLDHDNTSLEFLLALIKYIQSRV